MKRVFRFGVYYFSLLAITVLTSNIPAIAQVNFTTNEGQFIADNPGLAFQDFQAANVPVGMFELCAQPVNSNSNGNCFMPGDILPGIEFTGAPPIIDGLSSLCVTGEDLGGLNNNPPNMLLACFPEAIEEVSFTENITAVGLTLGCVKDVEEAVGCPQTITVSVFGRGDALLDSTDVAVTDLFNIFIGIESVPPITRISLMFPGSPEDVFKGIANVRFGLRVVSRPIPTLSEWGLIAMAGVLGIVGLLVVRRRKAAA